MAEEAAKKESPADDAAVRDVLKAEQEILAAKLALARKAVDSDALRRLLHAWRDAPSLVLHDTGPDLIFKNVIAELRARTQEAAAATEALGGVASAAPTKTGLAEQAVAAAAGGDGKLALAQLSLPLKLLVLFWTAAISFLGWRYWMLQDALNELRAPVAKLEERVPATLQADLAKIETKLDLLLSGRLQSSATHAVAPAQAASIPTAAAAPPAQTTSNAKPTP